MTLTRDTHQISIQVYPMNPTQMASARSKQHADKRKHKVRSRYMYLHLQRRISTLYTDTGLISLLRLILIKTNLNTIQTHPFIGKCPWLTFPLNMSKKWTPLAIFLTFLITGRPCLGLLLLSWVWTMRKADRNLGLEALHLAPT